MKEFIQGIYPSPSDVVRLGWKCLHACWEPIENADKELIGYCCYDCGLFEPLDTIELVAEEDGFGYFDEPQEIN